jgi:hypothetical protein
MSAAMILAQLAALDLSPAMRGEVLAIVAAGFAELEIAHKAVADELQRTRGAAVVRQRRHRAKIAGEKSDLFHTASGAPPIEEITSITSEDARHDNSRDIDSNRNVTDRDISKERKVSTPSKERNTTPRDVRAREGDSTKSCAITLQAFDLADAIGTEAGYTAATLPPGWCGAAGHIQRFLNEGYTPSVIRLACREVMRRGRGPPEYFGYFVKPIIDMRARLEAPLPHVKPHQLEVIDGGRQRTKIAPMEHASGPLQGAVQRIREELRRQTEPAESCPEPSGDVVRLLQAYGCQ